MAIYVMSDIHGHYKEFKKMLKLINFSENDYLYIVGDIVDKGKDSIKLLQEVMKMKNCTALLGNHDLMMFHVIREEHNEFNTFEDRHCMRDWYNNGGNVTKNEYDKLPSEEKIEIFNYLKNMPVVIPNLKVGDKVFYLVHACPFNRKLKTTKYMKDLGFSTEELEYYVWQRYRNYKFWWKPFDNKTVITGHCINYDGKIREVLKGLYDIDCGCAIDMNLGCLRLDDMKEFYVSCQDII